MKPREVLTTLMRQTVLFTMTANMVFHKESQVAWADEVGKAKHKEIQ
jgi:hypothetical protein